jgi:hypothetical protein
MATATTAAPSGNLGTTLPRATSHSGGFTSHSSTKKLSATTATNTPITLAKRARLSESDANRTTSTRANTAATPSGTPVNRCTAIMSPMYSAMSVAKTIATKGGASRG